MAGWKNGGRQPWVDVPQSDGEVWLMRQAGNADRALVRDTCEDARFEGHKVIVRSRDLANKLDRGLVLR